MCGHTAENGARDTKDDMATPPPGYSVTIRMDVPSSARATGDRLSSHTSQPPG